MASIERSSSATLMVGVHRATAVLRAVAAAEPGGCSTSDVARACALPRATVHRLLVALAHEGMLDRDAETARWTLGPEIYLMGSLAAAHYDITDRAGDLLRSLAQRTGESAFLSARRGEETVCLVEEEGSFPLRSHVLYEGRRFPLGVASAGIVLLAHLPDAQREDYLARTDLTGTWGPAHSAEALRIRAEETRARGYAVNPGYVVEGSWGLGAAVFDAQGSPRWALSLTGVESRFPAERIALLGRLLLDHAHALSQRLARPRVS